jgi:hypothetical protein
MTLISSNPSPQNQPANARERERERAEESSYGGEKLFSSSNLITIVAKQARFANLLQTKCQPKSGLQTQLWIFSTNQDPK